MTTFSLDEKMYAAEKFLTWLKDKYPMPHAVIKTEYENVPYLRNIKGIQASLFQDWLTFTVVVAMDRDVLVVLQSIAHEFCHIHQVMHGIMYHKIGEKEEAAAWNFSAHELRLYLAELGIEV